MVHLGPKKPPSRKGSMIDVPRDLMDQIAQLEKLFSVDTAKLNQIVDHFVSELGKGLGKGGGTIPMIPTWVMSMPTGNETGKYLALDMGGTNLRVVIVQLLGNRKFDVTQSKYHMPDHIKTGTSTELWDYIAECLDKFLTQHKHIIGEEAESGLVDLGFTFSYPCTQTAINNGVLQRWTKGFDIDNVENHDVQPMLEEALKRKNVPIRVLALINDTTGTMVASHYTDPNTQMGLIFGTGCNAAYFETVGDTPKLEGLVDIPDDTPMAINCEWGAFDNEHVMLPRTAYDAQIDNDSPRPNQQAFEKMIAGLYLGEILRLVLLDLNSQGFIFENQDVSSMTKPYSIDASLLAQVEEDPFENLSEVDDLFISRFNIITTEPERKLIRRLAELIGTRSARLSACGVAAICKKRNIQTCHAGADGSVFNRYPNFPERGAQALKEIFGWDDSLDPKDYPIKLVPAEDGSGVGAALIAALTSERVKKGLPVGMKEEYVNGSKPLPKF
ncbi:hexokinase-domain-containing protein [Lipomyces oligophaga]|uniref:hexokinase-domain-containing protein n=1 Tax=Lipomyces oligophaga TaxID=45792 RepID=UPI0034CE66AD